MQDRTCCKPCSDKRFSLVTILLTWCITLLEWALLLEWTIVAIGIIKDGTDFIQTANATTETFFSYIIHLQYSVP